MYFGVVFLLELTVITDLITAVGLDDPDVVVLQQVRKENDELLLFCGRPAAPLGTEGAPRHLRKVKARKDNPP